MGKSKSIPQIVLFIVTMSIEDYAQARTVKGSSLLIGGRLESEVCRFLQKQGEEYGCFIGRLAKR